MKTFIIMILIVLLACFTIGASVDTEVEEVTPPETPPEYEIGPAKIEAAYPAEKIKTVTVSVETEEIVEVEEVDPVPPVDPEDLEILAHLLGGEAGSDWCSDQMIYYVGSVVLNRVAADDFPDTIEGVVFQEGQYACTWDGNYDRKPSERHYLIAEDLLRNGSLLPPDVVFQAEFEQGSGVYAKVQNMYFCYRYYYEG